MSRKQKLIERFLARPRDFTYDELKKMLKGFNYRESVKGRTSGSRAAFINTKSGHIIRLYRPHPGNILKLYQMNEIEEALRKEGLFGEE
jgi:hypothetical protein